MSLEPDRPEVVAELAAAFAAYERALLQRDLEALADAFHDSDQIVRFGIRDRQQGAAQLARWRAEQPPLSAGRTLSQTVISTFGTDLGVVSTCVTYPDRPTLGRQSQTWLRLSGDWKIVAAHVSEIAAPR